MSPAVAFLLGAGLSMQASSLRTAPAQVISPEQMLEAAESVKDFLNGNHTWCLHAVKTSNTTHDVKTSNTTQKQKGVPLPGDGTPLPEGEFNWEVEDFNPDALKRSPCGVVTPKPERIGKGTVPTPQAKLVVALKLWIDMATENRKIDYAKACAKMDPFPAGGTADQKISQTEFVGWTDSQPFDGRVKTEQGEVVTAIFNVLKKRGEDHIPIADCKTDLEKLIKKLSN